MKHQHRRAKLTSALLAVTLVFSGMSGAVAAEGPEPVLDSAATTTVESLPEEVQEAVVEETETPALNAPAEEEPVEELQPKADAKPQASPTEKPAAEVSADKEKKETSAPAKTDAKPANAEAPAKADATPLAAAPKVTVSKTEGLDPEGETITVTGTGFTAEHEGALGVRPPLAGTFTGAYVVLGDFADQWSYADGAPTDSRKPNYAQRWAVLAEDVSKVGGERAGAIVVDPSGTFTATFEVSQQESINGNFGIYTYSGGGAKVKAFETFTPLTFAGEDSDAGEEEGTDKPEAPGEDGEGTDKPETPKEEDVVQQQAGKFAWGFKESFRNYIRSNIAHGEVRVAGGAIDNGDSYTFQQGSSSVKDGKGTVSYTGSVRFTGHDGELDSKFRNPQIVLTAANAGEISFEVDSLNLDDSSRNLTGQRVVVAKFTGAKLTTNEDGSVSYTATNVTLTADGARAFSDFYKTGDSLDAISFTIGADKDTTGGGENPGTGEPGVDEPGNETVAAKKPGTYKQADVDEQTLLPGGRFTITADGFGSNTKNIELYVYSEPVLLKKGITANANGAVTVTATLPQDLPAGTHTLSLEAPNGVKQQVSIRVLPFDKVTENPTDEGPTCVARVVSGATFSWGFKQSYINYVNRLSDGTISTSGASQSGGTFNWAGGTGKYNEDLAKGVINYGGSIKFTGHSGVMDSTFSNFRVQFNGPNSASIVANIASNDMEGNASSANSVYMATISLAGNKSVSGNTVTWSNAPVTLTAAGASAFGGFYEAGQAMDPATVSITLGAETNCDQASGTAGPGSGAGALSNTGAQGIEAGVAAAIFLLLAGAVAVIGNRRYAMQQR